MSTQGTVSYDQLYAQYIRTLDERDRAIDKTRWERRVVMIGAAVGILIVDVLLFVLIVYLGAVIVSM